MAVREPARVGGVFAGGAGAVWDATPNVTACRHALRQFGPQTDLPQAHKILEEIQAAHAAVWPKGSVGKVRDRLKDFFRDADFLHNLTGRFKLPSVKNAGEADVWRGAAASDDPLVQDWTWVRPHMVALLGLVQEFGIRFGEAKRELGAVDFHDLEQFSLRLLWDRQEQGPTQLARHWQEKLRLIFVDEYQDINAAQDAILQALSRQGPLANRFLVGDPKQSIYRFRLANPAIFQKYAREWRATPALGQVIPLTENFRSRSRILEFVNGVFEPLMRRQVGGVDYAELGLLTFGERSRPEVRASEDPADPVGEPESSGGEACLASIEVHLRLSQRSTESETGDSADSWMDALNNSEKEARLIGLRLAELRAQGRTVWDPDAKTRRAVNWGDMVILLRSPQRKVEAYAKEFSRLGIPLVASRGGFFESAEIMDVLSLLTIVDNPVQDIPLLTVLRSPFVALSFDELAIIRLAVKGRFWNALLRFHSTWRARTKASPASADEGNKLARALLEPELRRVGEAGWDKVHIFLERFAEWRRLVRQTSLSDCLERILRETGTRAFLRDGARGEQQRANLAKLLAWTRRFDQDQRQGLFHFLKFIEAQKEAEIDREPAPLASGNAVRLMSVHQSKGLEFGVVVLADMGKPFNTSDLKSSVILDEEYGLCPLVKPPTTEQRYPSLPHWLAQRRQRRELLGEELRLLYVAMTRARQCLILAGTVTRKAAEQWPEQMRVPNTRELLGARGYLDWVGPRLCSLAAGSSWLQAEAGQNALFSWRLYTDDATALQPEERAASNVPERSSAPDEKVVGDVLDRLHWQYPAPMPVAHPAKLSVSTVRARIIAEDADGESAAVHLSARQGVRRSNQKLTAAAIGTAHHIFLQHVDLAQVESQTVLAAEARRLESEGILTRAEREALDLQAIAAFWKSRVGAAVLGHAGLVRRELAFTTRMSAVELHQFRQNEAAELTQGEMRVSAAHEQWGSDEEFVVITGAIDLSVHLPNEIWIVDFKTDSVTAEDWDAKMRSYAPQMRLYALALSRIYNRPVAHLWLYSLALQKTEDFATAPPGGRCLMRGR